MDQPYIFEHAALEADITSLAQEIQKHKELPENREVGGTELIKKAIQSLPPVTGTAPTATQATQNNFLPKYADGAPPVIKLEVEYLLDLAFHVGLAKAAVEASKSPDFVQDVFHDVLAGKLYPELQKRGIVD